MADTRMPPIQLPAQLPQPLAHEPDAFDPGSVSKGPEGPSETSFSFSEKDIVKIHNDKGTDGMSTDQKRKVDRFYELLANAMPLEGRDYDVVFTAGGDGVSVKAVVEGHNPLGLAFAAQVKEFYSKFGNKE